MPLTLFDSPDYSTFKRQITVYCDERMTTLSAVQFQHLNSDIVLRQFAEDKVTLDQAAERSSPRKCAGLTPVQIKGVNMGLTPKEVKHPLYDKVHVAFCSRQLHYETFVYFLNTLPDNDHTWTSKEQTQRDETVNKIRVLLIYKNHGLTFPTLKKIDFNLFKAEGLRLGLSVEQVNNDWFGHLHVVCIESKRFSYEQIQGLTTNQLAGFSKGLSRELVTDREFDACQIPFILAGLFKFEEIKGLNAAQIHGLQVGLTRAQVEFPRFTQAHADKYEAGFSYEKIAGKKPEQLDKLEAPRDSSSMKLK